MKVLAFLQNMWVKRPEEVRRSIERWGEEFRVRFMRRALFAGCKTGRNLKKAFSEELLARIVFEETTREIAGDPKTIFPADLKHIQSCLVIHKPSVVLTFGKIAHDAVQPLICPTRRLRPPVHIHAHHPASRHPDSFYTLTLAAEQLRQYLLKVAVEDLRTELQPQPYMEVSEN